MIYFLDRGGIGDLLMRIPYYVYLARERKDRYKIILPYDKIELLGLFLPDDMLIGTNQSFLSRSIIYACWFKHKYQLGKNADKLVVSVPYGHRGILNCAARLGFKNTVMYEGESSGSKITMQGFKVIPNTFPCGEYSFDAHISRHCDAIFRAIYPDIPPYNEMYKNYPRMLSDCTAASGFDVVILTDAGVGYKKYQVENWQAFLDMLPRSLRLVQLGARQMRLSHPGLVNNETHSLKEIFSIIEGTPTVIGNDTGFVHWAYMTGAKTICLLGSGDLYRFLPWDSNIYPNIDCLYDKNCRCKSWNCRKCNMKTQVAPCISSILPERLLKVSLETIKNLNE